MKTVVALGGNALQSPGGKTTYSKYLSTIHETCRQIAPLAKKGQLLVVHGNGTEVGNLLLQQEASGVEPRMPLDVVVAETQGQIGYLLAQNMASEFSSAGIRKGAVCLITRILVDRNDEAFGRPTKPVGPLYTRGEHGKLRALHRMANVGKGWRRVVPSPRPVDIIEKEEIKALLMDNAVIACGGGGIPVIKSGKGFRGVEAVIDKDYAAALAARILGAEKLVILTDVDGVYINYGTKKRKLLREMDVREAEAYLERRKFGEGSMKPKVEAAIDFAKSGGECVIAHIRHAAKAAEGKNGTIIRNG